MNIFLSAEIVIFKSKDDSTGLRVGHPSFFLKLPDKIHLFEEPTLFLADRYVKNGRTASVHSWSAAADALKSWFEFLQVIERNWNEASRQDRLDYRDAFLSAISPRTGQIYEPSTIAARMVVVQEFYKYALEAGWYDGDIGSISKPGKKLLLTRPIDQQPLAHLGYSHMKEVDPDLPKKRSKVVIHPLRTNDLRALLNHCGPRASSKENDDRPSRNRLIVDLGWVVGLRVEEICSLTTLQFLSLHPNPNSPQIDFPLIVTGKGRKTRQVAIPSWLVADVICYINEERIGALKKGGVTTRTASTALLLSEPQSSRSGRPISIRRVQQLFSDFCMDIGLTESIEVINPETGEKSIKVKSKYSVHDLRHTAAVLIYQAERLSGNAEPWKRVQAQLGHKNLQTTIDTYLKHVEIFGTVERPYDLRKIVAI